MKFDQMKPTSPTPEWRMSTARKVVAKSQRKASSVLGPIGLDLKSHCSALDRFAAHSVAADFGDSNLWV